MRSTLECGMFRNDVMADNYGFSVELLGINKHCGFTMCVDRKGFFQKV